MNQSIEEARAINSLTPNAEWRCDKEGMEWQSPDIPQPTQAEIDAEIQRLQAEYDSKQYQRDRAEAYPPITDYLDGIVKGDIAQVDKYIADCQAVKVKYPKEI